MRIGLYINGVDARQAYGAALEDGALAQLMAFPPHKQPVTNKNATEPGAFVIDSTAGQVEERTVSLQVHIVATGMEDFLAKRQAFYAAITATHPLTIEVVLPNGSHYSYTMYYIDCQQYTQFLSGMAKFVLSLYEPMPSASVAQQNIT